MRDGDIGPDPSAWTSWVAYGYKFRQIWMEVADFNRNRASTERSSPLVAGSLKCGRCDAWDGRGR